MRRVIVEVDGVDRAAGGARRARVHRQRARCPPTAPPVQHRSTRRAMLRDFLRRDTLIES